MSNDFQLLINFLSKQNPKKNLVINNKKYQTNSRVIPYVNQKNKMKILIKKITGKQRILFTKEEDEKIISLVKIFGKNQWPVIAQFMEGRTAKQCRDRYSNYLVPGYFQGEWSKEDNLLIEIHNKVGSKWSYIKNYFPNRSANNIKNRWYYFLSKKTQNPINNIQSTNKNNDEQEVTNDTSTSYDDIFDYQVISENEQYEQLYGLNNFEIDDFNL